MVKIFYRFGIFTFISLISSISMGLASFDLIEFSKNYAESTKKIENYEMIIWDSSEYQFSDFILRFMEREMPNSHVFKYKNEIFENDRQKFEKLLSVLVEEYTVELEKMTRDISFALENSTGANKQQIEQMKNVFVEARKKYASRASAALSQTDLAARMYFYAKSAMYIALVLLLVVVAIVSVGEPFMFPTAVIGILITANLASVKIDSASKDFRSTKKRIEVQKLIADMMLNSGALEKVQVEIKDDQVMIFP